MADTSPNRRTSAITGSVVSAGDGSWSEVSTSLVTRFLDKFATYFSRKAGDFTAITAGGSLINRGVASAHLNDIETFGALTAFHLHLTQAIPESLSPLMMQFIVNGYDLHSITKAMLDAFAPNVLQQQRHWRGLGKDDPLIENDLKLLLLEEFNIDVSHSSPSVHRTSLFSRKYTADIHMFYLDCDIAASHAGCP